MVAQSGRRDMREAARLHGRIIAMGLHQHEPSLRTLFASFFASGDPSASIYWARLVFDRLQSPSTFIFNTMIRGYTAASDHLSAIVLYNRMIISGCLPDGYTFPFLLKACSKLPSLPKGQEAHCRVLKTGFGDQVFVQNSLIHLYGSSGELNLARQVFDEMFDRDIATWTTLVACHANFASIDAARRIFDDMPRRSVVSFSAMIAGYVGNGQFREALRLFQDLQIAKLEPNDSIIVSVLCASANLGCLESGRWVHSYLRKNKKNEMDSRITTALIDMYCKCGSLEEALYVFTGAKEKQTGEWTAMISGMAMHGLGERSIQLFEVMNRSGTKPNAVTFVALLSACTHGGLIAQGLQYFRRMQPEFGIEPAIEHLGCIVDLLGRAGLIEDAVNFMSGWQVKANAAVWGALLSACRVHRNVKVGEMAARMLVSEEPWNGGVYMTLLSLYREAGRWSEVERMKKEMKEAECRKNPGCSMIEVNGSCHEFLSSDTSCPLAWNVCSNLGMLMIIESEGSDRVSALSIFCNDLYI